MRLNLYRWAVLLQRSLLLVLARDVHEDADTNQEDHGKHERHPHPVKAPSRPAIRQLSREARDDPRTHLVALFDSK